MSVVQPGLTRPSTAVAAAPLHDVGDGRLHLIHRANVEI